MERLSWQATRTARGFVVELHGMADMITERDMWLLCSELHDTALEQGVREVILDLRGLGYMSSGAQRHIVGLIVKDSLLPPEKQYKIILRFDFSVYWQRRSTSALQCLAPVLVKLDPP